MRQFFFLLLSFCVLFSFTISVSAVSTPDYPEFGSKYTYYNWSGFGSWTVGGSSSFWDAVVNDLSSLGYGLSALFQRLGFINDSVSSIDSRLKTFVDKPIATAQNQVALNNKVSTASNQEILNNSVASFFSLFSSGYDSYSFTAGANEWIVGVTPNSGSFVKGFNSASLSILEGIRSIASVVASPEDKAFSDAMNSSENKQIVGEWNSANAGSSTNDSLLVGSAVIDNLQSPVGASEGIGYISDMFNGNGQFEGVWLYFSQYCADQLDSHGSASISSLDDERSLSDDDIVWFIEPNQSVYDRLNDFRDGR